MHRRDARPLPQRRGAQRQTLRPRLPESGRWTQALEVRSKRMENLAGGALMSPNGLLQPSGVFSPGVMEDIQTKAESGLYRIRGYGTLRERRWSTFDDLTFLPCSLTRIPLEGYREKCSTRTVLGTRFAEKPLELDIPIMITGMSWGALSWNAKVALAKGAASMGSSNTTGDGGMLAA